MKQVTIALASVRDFPWKKVPSYCIAQLLGCFCGAAIVYANYYRPINLYEGGSGIRTISGTGDLFATYPVRLLHHSGRLVLMVPSRLTT